MIFIKAKPSKAGMGMTGKGTGMVMGTKTLIGIRTQSTHTRLPAYPPGIPIPMTNTKRHHCLGPVYAHWSFGPFHTITWCYGGCRR